MMETREKVNIRTLNDLKKLRIGDTYEIGEWELKPEIIEKREAKLLHFP